MLYLTSYGVPNFQSPGMHLWRLPFPLLLAIWFARTDATNSAFLRNFTTLDFMNPFDYFFYGALPLQLAPIYGMRCWKKNCKKRQFFTVRLSNDAIVRFSNYWTSFIRNSGDRYFMKCPEKMLALGMSCIQGDCHKLQILCGITTERFTIIPTDSKLVWTARRGKRATCPDGMYAQWIGCVSGYCDPVGLYCVKVEFQKLPERKLPLLPLNNRKMVSNIFSSAKKGYSQLMNGPVYSILCHKSLCEEMQLVSVARGSKKLLGPVQVWTNHASARGTTVSCPSGMVMRQMRCRNECCSKVYLGCAAPTGENLVQIDGNDTRNSNVFGSYGLPPGKCPDGYYVKKISCFDDNCGRMVANCVKLTFIECVNRKL